MLKTDPFLFARLGAAALLALTACNKADMADRAKLRPLESSAFFDDGRSARPFPPGTVARGHLKLDSHLYEGKTGSDWAASFPFPATPGVLKRGQERFNIQCAVCHDRAGTGRGMVVRRGFRQPPSLHEPRLREARPGYLFDVITRGMGAMPAQGERISTKDRWSIVAYIRALQRSRNARWSDVPEAERRTLRGETR